MGCFSPQQCHKPVHRLGIAGSEVVSSSGEWGLCRSKKSTGDVSHVQKIARLAAITDNSVWLATKFLPQEYTEYRAVGPGRARPCSIGIKNTDRIRRELVDLVPVKHRLLTLILR